MKVVLCDLCGAEIYRREAIVDSERMGVQWVNKYGVVKKRDICEACVVKLEHFLESISKKE
ncbi:MAG: hypothetical protein ACRD4Q_01965 [Candidatus Acidiferrales bacterium]